MDLNKYRNLLNSLITWEWIFLKHLRRKRRNILLRGAFAIFSLLSILFYVFWPPLIIGGLLTDAGFSYSLVGWSRIISFFVWLWFISPKDKLSKKERDVKNKRKLEVIKAVEKFREKYDTKFK